MNPGDLIHERYRLESPLGRGGRGEVWRALDERLQRPVAIKFLTSRYADDPEFLVRFFSEAQAVAAISHAHVIRVTDFGSGDDGPFLVMELVDGGSLSDRAGSPLPIEEACTLIAQAAAGAGAAHAQGVVHRDVKPGNILLTPTGSLKLADFGIATLGAVDHLAETGTAIGSPHYISPEGAQGKDVCPASDVYSLGVVLYELLTGRRPFETGSATSLALAHVEQTPPAPSTHRPEVPGWVDALVLKCLAKNPQERFADGAELAEALRAGASGAAVLAPAPEDHATAGLPRRRLVASLVSVAVLGLAGFLIAAPGSPVTPSAEADIADPVTKDRRPRPLATVDPGTTQPAADVSTKPSKSPSPTPTPSDEPEEEDEGDGDEELTTQGTGDEGAPAEGTSEEEAVEEPTEEPSPKETAPTSEEPAPEETEEAPADGSGSERTEEAQGETTDQ